MTAVRGHCLLRRFRPERPDVLVLFMALLLKQVWTGRTSGRRGTWNGRRAPAACLPWRRPQTLVCAAVTYTPQPQYLCAVGRRQLSGVLGRILRAAPRAKRFFNVGVDKIARTSEALSTPRTQGQAISACKSRR